MAKLVINDGTVANDGTGDSLRTAAYKINQNFTEVYAGLADIATVGHTGNYNDLINKPTIATTIRDLSDPFLDLDQVRGTMTSSITTDGGLYSIGDASRQLRAVYSTEINSGTTAELSLIGEGISVNAGTDNMFLSSNVMTITTTGQLDINAQEVNIIGQVNANVAGNITATDGTSLINAATAAIVGPINTANTATFSGTVDFTDATVIGLSSSVDFNDLGSLPTTIAGYGITDAFDGAFSSLSGKPTTLAGYGITDAATTAQGALADSALQPSDVGPLASSTVLNYGDFLDVITDAPQIEDFWTAFSITSGSSAGLTYDNTNGEFTYTAPTIPTTVAELSDAGDYALVGDIANDYISLATLKSEVAASVDFADFQTRIAAL